MKKRQISQSFMDDLLKGSLNPLLKEVQEDDTLDLELRGNNINIYYRGGSLFKITEVSAGNYVIKFDVNYCISPSVDLQESPSVDVAVKNIVWYKRAMDKWFNKYGKYEREFQQVIARENNYVGKISKSTDYFIADIEYAGKEEVGYRFDMVGLKWKSTSSDRKNVKKPTLALIEVKYGIGALSGSAGVAKHLKDFGVFLSNQQNVNDLCADMSVVFKQKCLLGLVDELSPDQFDVSIQVRDIEVIFIFANLDPESKKLKDIFNDVCVQTELANIKEKGIASIKVAKASAMGYGLYEDKIVDVNDFIAGLNSVEILE